MLSTKVKSRAEPVSRTCGICTEKHKVQVVCVLCSFHSCKSCTKKIILASPKDAACCSCKHPWTDDFVESQLKRSWFRGEYRRNRKQLLLENQKNLLSATMPEVQRRKNILRALDNIEDLKKEIKRIDNEIVMLQNQIRRWRQPSSLSSSAKKKFTIRCANDICKGFVSHEDQGRCAICKTVTCIKCRIKKVIGGTEGGFHVCKEEDLASAAEIQNNSTQCPKCFVQIYRSEGCDQMFCVLCYTAFSYRTGIIERGVIHNPHMYEIQNRLGINLRNIGDIPCGGFPTLNELTSALSREHPRLREYSRRLQLLNHIAEVELQRWRPLTGDFCEELRVNFMMGIIKEDHFASMVSKKHIDNRIKQNICEIFQAFVSANQDIMNRLVIDANQYKKEMNDENGGLVVSGVFLDDSYTREMNGTITYTNDALRSVGTRYGRSYPVIPSRYNNLTPVRMEMRRWNFRSEKPQPQPQMIEL